ncbi:MAG: exodeoxyribonuclease VII small subunit [Vulcanimicrobiaceae bacterium]
MAEKEQSTFEAKVARLEAIVTDLESGNVELDKAVALFKEGKTLSRECEDLLKVAQHQIDKAMEGTAPPTTPEPFDDEIPF